MIISIIFPVYNEQENLQQLYQQLVQIIQKINFDFEFIFVDDASTDCTPQILKILHENDKRIKVIRFSRNCGSHAALAAGLINCKGDCAINLSADLQDPLELILHLIREWEKKTAKIVWGVRAGREGERKRKRFFAKLYYILINWLTDVKIPPAGTDVFLLDRVVIEAFKEIKEKHTSIFMTLAWFGFPHAYIQYIKASRFGGKSKWTFWKQFKLTLDSILSFSDIPIRYASALGMLTTLLGFLYALSIIWHYFHGSPVQGWSSLVVIILIVGGMQMMILGILGEYLWRTFDEARRRPRYVIEYKIE